MSEIKSLSIVQYKKFIDAIGERELEKYKIQAKVIRSCLSDKRGFENFMRSLESCKSSERVLSEKELRNIGFGKKRK